eukprot:6727780-Ditylum_brightwellii.AAC.1
MAIAWKSTASSSSTLLTSKTSIGNSTHHCVSTKTKKKLGTELMASHNKSPIHTSSASCVQAVGKQKTACTLFADNNDGTKKAISNQQEKKNMKTAKAKKETAEENQRESLPFTLSKLDITGEKHQSKKQQKAPINQDGEEKAEEEANKKERKMKKGKSKQ